MINPEIKSDKMLIFSVIYLHDSLFQFLVERHHRAILDMIPAQAYRITGAGIFVDFKPAKDFGSAEFNEHFRGKKIGDFLPLKCSAARTRNRLSA
ncbi:MAG: hypothetical protein NT075_04490 [Chloroflexi bacterium]|nr:hypothetical protein [Chloroflexota bacterium]